MVNIEKEKITKKEIKKDLALKIGMFLVLTGLLIMIIATYISFINN